MQSVMEAWTHHADPSFCLLSEGQLEAIRNEGVNKVMKEMIRKYLLPQTSQNGVKHIIVKEDNQYFEKMVGVSFIVKGRSRKSWRINKSWLKSTRMDYPNMTKASILTCLQRR